MEEHGIVVALRENQAVVRVQGAESCYSCSSQQFCIMGGDGSVHILAENPLDAKESDQVTVSLGEGRKIAGTAIVFLTPVLGMFVGLFFGISRYGTGGGVIGAGAGIVLGLITLRLVDRWLGKRSTFRPRIICINQESRDSAARNQLHRV